MKPASPALLIAALTISLSLGSMPIYAQTAAPQNGSESGSQTALSPVAQTRVLLAIPQGYETSGRFTGLINPQNGASIMITEIPGPFSQTSKGFTKEKMLERGLVLQTYKNLEVSNKPALYLEFKQAAYGQSFQKYLLHFGDELFSISVLGTIPTTAPTADSTILKATVCSTSFNAQAAKADLDEGLPFAVSNGEKLKKINRIQNSIIMSEENSTKDKARKPLLIIAPSIAFLPISDRNTFALKRLKASANLEIKEIISTTSLKKASLEGIEIVAQAADKKTGEATILYQLMLFDKNGYYLMQGLCPAQEKAIWLPEFATIADSFKLKAGAQKPW